MSTFQIIRLSEGFALAIAVSPYGADFKTLGRRYFFYDAEGRGPKEFVEVSEDRVTGYFSGHADGMGYEIPPDDVFAGLEAVFQWVAEKRGEWAKAELAKHPEWQGENWKEVIASLLRFHPEWREPPE